MKVTEVEKKESTKHCCGNGCCRRDSAEHEEEGRAHIDQRITELLLSEGYSQSSRWEQGGKRLDIAAHGDDNNHHFVISDKSLLPWGASISIPLL